MAREAGRHALAIGVSGYGLDPALPALRTPVADAEAVARSLERFCSFGGVRTLSDPGKAQIEEAITTLLLDRSEGDLALLYFSGHGTLGHQTRLYLCAADTRTTNLFATGLDVKWLGEVMEASPAGQIVLVLDCCYAGGAVNAVKTADQTVAAVLNAGRGKYVITSSSAFELSNELSGDAHSLFTKWWLHGLADGRADQDGDGIVTLEELYAHVHQGVTTDDPGQTPQLIQYKVGTGAVELVRSAATVPGSVRAARVQVDELPILSRRFSEGRIVPLLGPGLFGDGPLSNTAIARALLARGGLESLGDCDLPAAAEYLGREDRPELLRTLHEILEAGAARTVAPPLCEALVAYARGVKAGTAGGAGEAGRPPLFVISTSYDDVVEQALLRGGLELAVVAHVLHSEGTAWQGQVVTWQRGPATCAATICPPDKLLLNPAWQVVVYKPLGSPHLNAWLEQDPSSPCAWDGVDTVVATESDHVDFVGGAQRQRASMPNVLAARLRSKQILYLGYQADLWHYRLVQTFLKVQGGKDYTVRLNASPYEEGWWNALKAQTIRLDPDNFGRLLAEAVGGAVP